MSHPSGEVVVHKLHQKCPRVKGVDDLGIIILLPILAGMNKLIAENEKVKQKRFRPTSGNASDTQTLTPPTIVSPSNPKCTTSLTKNRVSLEDPMSTTSLKHVEKFLKAMFRTSEGERILKTDRCLHNPKIGSGLMIILVLDTNME